MKNFPIKSMTAYGQAQHSFDFGQISVEIQSVNRKHLEITCYLPKKFHKFEQELRKILSSKIGRGMVTLSVRYEANEDKETIIRPNLARARILANAWQQIAEEIGTHEKPSLALFAQDREIVLYESREADNEEILGLKKTVTSACAMLIEVKEREGRELQGDLLARLRRIDEILVQIHELSGSMTESIQKKLQQRLATLLEVQQQDERIYKEIALMAEKSDITEEQVRLAAHVRAVYKLLTDPLNELCEGIGKRIEFFLQEIARELNTICAKATSEIIPLAIEAKAENEKIREQIQNIE